jgi:Zn finger protein HypA/HybF involved in hydrogenase expression
MDSREYKENIMKYKFVCKCGNEWYGYDAGDGECPKCGKYSIGGVWIWESK